MSFEDLAMYSLDMAKCKVIVNGQTGVCIDGDGDSFGVLILDVFQKDHEKETLYLVVHPSIAEHLAKATGKIATMLEDK